MLVEKLKFLQYYSTKLTKILQKTKKSREILETRSLLGKTLHKN